MAEFNGTIITIRGRNLLAKAMSGGTLTFSRIGLGDGIWPVEDNPEEMLALVQECRTVSIQTIETTSETGTTRIRFVLSNANMDAGFFLREIGIFATDPDLGEILYAVTYAGLYADFIPASGVTQIEDVTDIYTVISTAQNVTAVIDEAMILATREDIAEHNENMGCHQDIRGVFGAHSAASTAHAIPAQIAAATAAHDANPAAHAGIMSRYDHTQAAALATWAVNHNKGTLAIPVVGVYAETTESIALDGYCGYGATCGGGITAGSGAVATMPVETPLALLDILLVSQNRTDIRFAAPHSGKAILFF